MNFNSMLKDELVDLAVRRFLFSDSLPPLNSKEYDELISSVKSGNNKDDLIKLLEGNNVRGFEVVKNELRKYPNVEIKKPKHGSKHSAGYDLFTIGTTRLLAGKSITLVSDICAYMQEDEKLDILIRSSLGIKKDIVLKNQVGLIDSDYYNNYGNIHIALRNMGDKPQVLDGRVVQCVFSKFLKADNYNTTTERVSGIGSSGKD